MSYIYFGLATTWLTGIANGYKLTSSRQKEGLSPSNKYSVLSITTVLGVVEVLKRVKLPIVGTGSIYGAMFIGTPLLVGSTFCLGSQLGKAVGSSEKLRPQ